MMTIFLRYQSESAELNEWLQDALERLEFWNNQSVTVPEEVETVRDHLSAFLVSTNLVRKHVSTVSLFQMSLKTNLKTKSEPLNAL